MHLMHFSLVVIVLSSFLHRSCTAPQSPVFSTDLKLLTCRKVWHGPHLTACQQFYHLTHTPSAICLLLPCSRTLVFGSSCLLTVLLLSGDIKLYPDPPNVTICTINIRSIRHPLHSAAVVEGRTDSCWLMMMMIMMMMMMRRRLSGKKTEAAEGRRRQSLHVERPQHRSQCHCIRQSVPLLRLRQVHTGLLSCASVNWLLRLDSPACDGG